MKNKAVLFLFFFEAIFFQKGEASDLGRRIGNRNQSRSVKDPMLTISGKAFPILSRTENIKKQTNELRVASLPDVSAEEKPEEEKPRSCSLPKVKKVGLVALAREKFIKAGQDGVRKKGY